MPRKKKDSVAFSCKLDKKVFEKLEYYCKLSGHSKTIIVEKSIMKFIESNLEKARDFYENL